MGSRRDNDGRLNMDAVRDEREDVSTQYTAEWLSNVQMPPKAHSVVQDIDEPHSPRVSRSAPALSVKSRQSNAGISRSKLQLQLRQLKEKQQLDREARHLELEMQRQELELERKRRFAEIAERKELQEMEAKLAHAELLEQFEVDSDDQISDDGNRELNMMSHDHEGNGPYDDAEQRDAERRDTERRDAESRNAERGDAERRDAESRDTERRDAERRDAESRDTERRDAERRDTERRDAERQDAEQRETERRDAERRDAERRDAERRDAERRDTERQDAEQRETERRDAERRDAESRDAERRNAERGDAERQEAERRETESRELYRRDELFSHARYNAEQFRMPYGTYNNTFMNPQVPTTQMYQRGYTTDQQTQLVHPNFVPTMYQDAVQSSCPQYGNVHSHNRQFQHPTSDSQQMFEQQQQALRLMATTIGSTISKGFVMPKREYMSFDGNPLDYPSFTTNFKTNVEDGESDPNVRRTYLIQLCTGKAKEAISGSVMLPPEEGYKKAKSILHEMFGQAHIVAASNIDRVTKGSIIRENESEKLMQLARDMENCGMNLNKLGYQSDINSRHNIRAIVLRLPKYLRSDWAKEANKLRDQRSEPDFAALTKFVVNKAKLANTEYGRLVNVKMDWERNKTKSYGKQQRNVSAYQVSNISSNEEQDVRKAIR
ncbi:Hypothetical predicted protein [Paramuricea clavata]|uniref:Uncharacterized protein n=1 Tax=Paramuricea clavata TaxID=317549 RepID=A0A6S7KGP9_PARCT|nr:Hypothetical predicted protein [Paramuricea clavata]